MSKTHFILQTISGERIELPSGTTDIIEMRRIEGEGVSRIVVTMLGCHALEVRTIADSERARLTDWLAADAHFFTTTNGRWLNGRHRVGDAAPLDARKLRAETHDAIREAVKVEVAAQLANITGRLNPRDEFIAHNLGEPWRPLIPTWKGRETRRLMVPPTSLPVEDVPREGQTPYGYVVGHLSNPALECLRDVVSHASDFIEALRARTLNAKQDDTDNRDIDAPLLTAAGPDESYWLHQQHVFERMVAQAQDALAIHDKVNPKPETEPVAQPLTGTLKPITAEDIMHYPKPNSTGPTYAARLAKQYNREWAGATWTIKDGRVEYTWPNGETK